MFNILKKTVYILCIIILFSFAFNIFWGDKGYLEHRKLSKEKNLLLKKNVDIKKENYNLQKEIKNLKNEEYIEMIGRKEYGMVEKDEKIYKFIDKKDVQ